MLRYRITFALVSYKGQNHTTSRHEMLLLNKNGRRSTTGLSRLRGTQKNKETTGVALCLLFFGHMHC
jgi:hypothetical protein